MGIQQISLIENDYLQNGVELRILPVERITMLELTIVPQTQYRCYLGQDERSRDAI